MRSMNKGNRQARQLGVAASVLLMTAMLIPPGRTDVPESAPASSPAPSQTLSPALRNVRLSGLEERVRLLTVELGLDTRQQSEVRRLLQAQREQVLKIWNDTAVAPAYRVLATRAIGDKTADRIRALLNDEQKAKYNAPRKPRTPGTAATADSKLSVEDWMNLANQK
jgi:hypothetical protein